MRVTIERRSLVVRFVVAGSRRKAEHVRSSIELMQVKPKCQPHAKMGCFVSIAGCK
jgi:hypothetical protein